MKNRTLNLLLLCLTVLTAYAHPSQSNILKMQQDSIPTDSVYELVEEMPSFPGGQKAMMAFLAKNIQYPEELQNVRGRIIAPQFPGGEEALQAYLKEHVKYPSASKKRNEQGTVIISFVVMADGNRRRVEVKEGVSARLDAEALRVVNDMPKWIPGKKGDTTTNVITSVKIEFKLP